MLIDNDFVKAEHKYRGHKLAEIYSKGKNVSGFKLIGRAERPNSRLLALRGLVNVATDPRQTT